MSALSEIQFYIYLVFCAADRNPLIYLICRLTGTYSLCYYLCSCHDRNEDILSKLLSFSAFSDFNSRNDQKKKHNLDLILLNVGHQWILWFVNETLMWADCVAVLCLHLSAGNPLLLNSSMQPDLTVGRTYSTPLCFQDGADKELFDPLPDIKVKVQSSFMVSLGVAERAEFHAKGPAETFPRDLSRDYSSTADRRKKGLLTLNGPFSAGKELLRTTGVFGHPGGRLVVPNTGEIHRK